MGKRNPDSLAWYDTPSLGGEISFVGYNQWGERWKDVENGDWSMERRFGDPPDFSDVEKVTVHYRNPETGEDFYRVVHGPFPEDWDDVVEYIDYILDPYSEV